MRGNVWSGKAVWTKPMTTSLLQVADNMVSNIQQEATCVIQLRFMSKYFHRPSFLHKNC